MQAILRDGWNSAVGTIPARSRALLPAALTCAVLWGLATAAATRGLGAGAVAPLLAAGLATTAVLLAVIPVVARAETLGLIEAYRDGERPWSRVEINRARVIANQFAAVIGNLAAPAPAPAPGSRPPV